MKHFPSAVHWETREAALPRRRRLGYLARHGIMRARHGNIWHGTDPPDLGTARHGTSLQQWHKAHKQGVLTKSSIPGGVARGFHSGSESLSNGVGGAGVLQSGNLGIQKSGSLEIWESGNLGIWKSRNLGICKSNNFYERVTIGR